MEITKLVDDVVNRYMDEIMIGDLIKLNGQKIDKAWIKKSLLMMYLLQQKELGARNVVDTNQTYSIKEIFEKYLAGKKLNEFYDGYTGGKRRSELPEEMFSLEYHQKLIYKQLDSTFKIFNKLSEYLGIRNNNSKWKQDEIPAAAIPNLLFYLQEYYHPVMKAFRTDRYVGLTEQDWRDFSEKAVKYANNLDHGQSDIYPKLAAETIFNSTYYRASTNLVGEISETISDDLMQTGQLGNLALRFKVLAVYDENIKNAINASRNTVQAIINTMKNVNSDFVDELFDLELKNTAVNLPAIEEEKIERWIQELLMEADKLTKRYDMRPEIVDSDLKKALIKIMMKQRESSLIAGRTVELPNKE